MLKEIRLIQAYYLGSPLFFLLGLWWGFEVRVTFLPDPALRFAYYVVLSGLGLLTHFRPNSGPWVALCESAVNLFLILGWILLPIYALPEAALEGGALELPYTAREVLINGGDLLPRGFLPGSECPSQEDPLARWPGKARPLDQVRSRGPRPSSQRSLRPLVLDPKRALR